LNLFYIETTHSLSTNIEFLKINKRYHG